MINNRFLAHSGADLETFSKAGREDKGGCGLGDHFGKMACKFILKTRINIIIKPIHDI